MIVGLKPYPAMKDSGVRRLGEMPEHWECAAVRRYSRVFAGATPSRAVPEYWSGGTIPWLASGDVNVRRIRGARQFISEAGYAASSTKWIGPGSLVVALAGQGRTKGMVATVECRATCNQSLAAIEPSPRMSDYHFLAYYLESCYLDLRALVGDGLRDGLNLEHVRAILTPLPPLAEQTAIVRFLDHADRRIRRYIRAKQKLIKLLEEQKQAIIHRAVTRGLDPNIRLKPSGVEWLGDVPEHWEMRRNGRLFAQRNETGFGDLPILEVSLRTGVRARDFEKSDRKQVMEDREKYKRAVAGDIAYNMMRMWQGAVGVAPVDGLISPAYVVARPLPGTESRYFELLFRLPAYMGEVDKYSRGIVKDRNRLYWEDFKQIPSCCPPYSEQVAIADAIAQLTAGIDAANHRVRCEIALLGEYRTRLIADVVTGKRDVREAAARLPQEAEDVEPLDEPEALGEASDDSAGDGLDQEPEEAEA